MILEYLFSAHIQDCVDILSENDNLAYYSINIDFLKLFESFPDIGDKVLCSPIDTLPACNRDIIKAQQNLIEKEEYKNVIVKLEHCSLKRNVHARFFGLPVCPELHRIIFPKNVDLGCFLKVNGTVVRVTQTKMLEYQRKYVCMKCKYENSVEADFENRYILRAPTKCGNTESRCKCSTFTQVNMVSREYCKDYQEIKIQEQVNKLSIGTIPGSMWVVLEDDLVDSCKPGDDVIICGTVRRRWRPSTQTKRSEVELVLHANYIEVSNAQRSEVIASAPDVKDCFDEFWDKYKHCPLKGRDQILASVCPQVYGLHLVKLALLLTVITGSNHTLENDDDKKNTFNDDKHITRVRGQCHLLLVGDPGTGKSQLLRAGTELTPRSVFTSGAGSTRAGLTCAALREDGEWQLEAGALVLSDGGVCCIDEISHLRDHDRTAIHEAMEQQTISIAKAGIVCKLNTRCAVIAACNPKGNYQTDQPLSVNVSLGTPLLSRFDLIFILLDSKNKNWDKLVSSYILFGGANSSDSKKRWSIEKLQMYIGLIGPRQMEMTKAANSILQHYYMMQRKSEYRDPSRTTVRMLDSLVRLSQAHCRLMYRNTILPVDAIMAVSLVDISMQDCTLSDTEDALHSTFHKYPDYEYLCMARKLLTRLSLEEIWREELLYYAKLLEVDHKTLENEIANGSNALFAKFDDVEDINVPLSATVITSSYFNNKNDGVGKSCVNDKENRINNKLAKTLMKHSTLNKNERKLPVIQKKATAKRKRKEVTVDTSGQITDIKRIKRKNTKKKKSLNTKDESGSDNEDVDVNNMLKAIPSVNDVFNDLGIDFNDSNDNLEALDLDDNVTNNKPSNHVIPNINEKSEEIKIKEEKEQLEEFEEENGNIRSDKTSNIVDKLNNSEITPNKSSSINKLKQFTFAGKCDINKYYGDKLKQELSDNVQKKSISESYNKKPVSSSQISMFESDCDIDLDII
ncbi:DNA helicase MCM9-like isoform X2 [Colias croceus]|uniref:DNA helicase MCM9-like isoform X2 n=1 Tax=Colias crocea TaxID=72248 RepID=UPI001E27FFB8|nr:DNA helicase MCM9-like isoform X2 [Colias croceus]